MGLLGSAPAWPLTTDSAQATDIQSDHAELDDRARKAIYTGNVEVVKGSLHIWGDKMTIYYDEHNDLKEGYMVGKPSRFCQQPDKGDEVHGDALEFEYYVQKNLMHLKKDAHVTQGDRLFSGAFLTYDTQKSVVTGEKDLPAETTTTTEPGGKQRVRVLFPPKGPPGSTPAPKPAAPATATCATAGPGGAPPTAAASPAAPSSAAPAAPAVPAAPAAKAKGSH